jgi:Uma2 family endonuclease
MPVVIDAVVIDERFLPATLTAPPMTDVEFEAFCAAHPDLCIEMSAEGELVIMPPAHWFTAARSGEILAQLRNWAKTTRRGVVVDASGGFRLANGARRSPAAAWVSHQRVTGMPIAGPGRTWLLCPEFVVEVRSESDRLPAVRRKMREWIENGAELGWLVDPHRRAVEVFCPRADMRVFVGVDRIAGEGPVEGFTLELAEVWNPLA